MTLSEFLSGLGPSFYRMASDPILTYPSFGNVAVGIELLGACADEHDFHAERQSRSRFNRGISDYMAKVDPRYLTYNDPRSPFNLFRHLRCGMAHVLRPAGTVAFTSTLEAAKEGTRHLEECECGGKKMLILVAEQFAADFTTACERLRAELPTLETKYPKLKNPFISIFTPDTPPPP